jgi:predicted phosphodiesterase
VLNPGSLLAPRDGLPGMAMLEIEPDTRPVITWVDVDL